MDKKHLHQIQKLVGHKFSDIDLLELALTHSSSCGSRLESNERLEFFGDAVLDMIICEELFNKFPRYLEGDLTKVKSMLVSRKTCAEIAEELGLAEFLKVGKGISPNNSMPSSIVAGLLESLIGAIYMDGGYKPVQKFVLKIFGDLIYEADAEETHGNYKSLLQQYGQKKLNITPIYQLLDEKGPDHSKCFETAVVIGTRRFSSAWGSNKKEAEQKAAYNALIELGALEEAMAEQDE